MAIYKTTSIKSVILKLYRDLALDDPNYELDFIEWMGEALELIGSFSQMELKNTELTVADYKVALPTDFVSMQQVAKVKDDTTGSSANSEIISYNPSSFFAHEANSPNLDVKTEDSYTLNPDYIITDFETGTLLISYLSIPTDSDGYPKIPDNQYFKEALFWYCYRQMLLQGFQPRVKTIDYHFADQKWQRYCTAARNKANFPDIGGYQRFKDVWVGLLPTNMASRGFDALDPDRVPLEEIDASNVND